MTRLAAPRVYTTGGDALMTVVHGGRVNNVEAAVEQPGVVASSCLQKALNPYLKRSVWSFYWDHCQSYRLNLCPSNSSVSYSYGCVFHLFILFFCSTQKPKHLGVGKKQEKWMGMAEAMR